MRLVQEIHLPSKSTTRRASRKATVEPSDGQVEFLSAQQLAERQDMATRRYFATVARSQVSSLEFLKAAGILTAAGSLAKPFRAR